MNIQSITNVVTQFGHRSLLVARKHAPTILTGLGVAGGTATVVLAAKATYDHLDDVLTDHRLDVEDVKRNKPENNGRDIAYVYGKTSLKLAKIYAPAASVGLLSATAVISAHGMMQKREAALTAAYVALEKGFNKYRKRVEEVVGAEKEYDLRHGITEERLDDTKKGEVKTIRKAPKDHSIYARFFDELSPAWNPRPDMNLMFIKAQQNLANQRLHAKGHVFLNEVYDSLGLPRTQAGQAVGWVLSKDGDNYIDFGLYDVDNERVRAFINGEEAAILLDFNVDGVIWDKI